MQWNKFVTAKTKNERHYETPDPVKCLQTHLNKLVLKNYNGGMQHVSFAKFFVSNAEVLNEIKFGVNEKIDKKWVAHQHRLLGVDTKASRDAQLVFRSGSSNFDNLVDIHDFSVADPFNRSYLDGLDALSGEVCR